MRARHLLACVAALALVACDGESTSVDAGRDAGGGTPDSGGGGDDAGGGGDDAGGGMDAGGGGDDAGGGDDDAGGGDDASTPTDGGPIGACTPAPVTIMETCPGFTPCDASLVGAWCYTGVCVEEDEVFGGLPGGCSAELDEDFTGTITGRVEATATTLTREANTHIEGTVHITGTCTLAGCSTIESLVNSELGSAGSATCMTVSAGCDCYITLDSTVDNTDTYSTDGAGHLMVGTGGGTRTYDYCVDSTDGSLRVQETTATGAEPGIQSLAPES